MNNYYNSYAKNSKKYVVCPNIDENQKRGAILGGKRRGQGNDPNGAKTTVTNDRIFGGAAPYTYKENKNLRDRRNFNRVFMSPLQSTYARIGEEAREKHIYMTK